MTDNGTFRLPDQIGLLPLSGPWEGAEVRVRITAPLRMYFRFVEVVDSSDMSLLRPALREWAETILVGWNICAADGTSLPATADGFEQLPLAGAVGMISAWLHLVPEVDLPLAQPSPAGATSAGSRAKRRRASS